MLNNALILTVDASRARGFRVIQSDTPNVPFVLKEEQVWVRPEGRIPLGKRFAGSSPLGVRAGRFGQAHTFDDHREANDLDHRRAFAKQVSQELSAWSGTAGATRLVILATHAMRSLLEAELAHHPNRRLSTTWLTGEHTRSTPTELASAIERHLHH